MLLLFLYLTPILVTGILILQKISLVKRAELLLPAGIILGLTIFTFLLNLIAFVIKGSAGIIISYSLIILAGIALKKYKSENEKFDLPKNKELLFWLLSFFIWGGFLYWKTAHALIGSDTNLYYAVAHSFLKGNFPLLTPWQPDIPLSYHTGASEILASFYLFSGLNFQFLHLFFSMLSIFCSVQIVIWLIKRHNSLMSFLLANLTAAVSFIGFGFVYITWPNFPLQLPNINNINQLILWLRDLPTVNQAIEVYGAPVNLDALIYFIFHAFGLAIFFSLLVLVINLRKEKSSLGWIIICVGLAGLALVNESLFIASFPAIILGIFLVELKAKTLKKNLGRLFLLFTLTTVVIFFQGGMISASINTAPNVEKSAIIFPKKTDIKDDFTAYHYGQAISKLLPVNVKQVPLRWLHVGIDFLLVLGLSAIFIVKDKLNQSIYMKVLFATALFSLIAYNLIVPKFLVANGNRFLSAAFLFLALTFCLSLTALFESFKKSQLKRVAFLVIIGWIFIPTILPPLAMFSKTRFGENKLIPKKQENSAGILWLRDNIKFRGRIMVLDKNAPHPSGQERALVEAGVFAPLFFGNFRTFTIEASPQYIDLAYYLSPQALKLLGVNTLLIDDVFFQTLPEIRRKQLQENTYFKMIFKNSNVSGWERIYRINDAYLENGGELDGSLTQLREILPKSGRIYIDNEEAFDPSFLRRPVIFNLRDRDIYYLPQSGVYLNVETDINYHPPLENGGYDYLILGKNTVPERICRCQIKLIWTGVKDKVFVWKKIN